MRLHMSFQRHLRYSRKLEGIVQDGMSHAMLSQQWLSKKESLRQSFSWRDVRVLTCRHFFMQEEWL